MREILFRGKRVDSGMWIQGYLFQCWGRAYILWGMTNNVPTMHEVIPETVGQFTGLLDKHGRKIFEGDIVDITDHTIEETFEKFGAICKQLMTRRYEVIWNNVQWAISLISNQLVQPIIFELPNQNVTYEIIGNIHDNPESLGGK